MSLTSYQTALLCDIKLVGEAGIEPAASRLSVVCANQLRHSPILVIPAGFEPTILAWKASDLATCLRDHLVISFFISYYIYIIAYFFGFVHSFSCYNLKYFFIWGGLQESNLLTSGHSRLPKPSGSNHHIGGQWENRTHSSHMTSVLQTDSPTLTN